MFLVSKKSALGAVVCRTCAPTSATPRQLMTRPDHHDARVPFFRASTKAPAPQFFLFCRRRARAMFRVSQIDYKGLAGLPTPTT